MAKLIAREDYALEVGNGSCSSYTANRGVTKARAVSYGASVSGSYSDNLLVAKEDLYKRYCSCNGGYCRGYDSCPSYSACKCNNDCSDCGYVPCSCNNDCVDCGYTAASCSCNGDGCTKTACKCDNDCANCGYTACSCVGQCSNACSSKTACSCKNDTCSTYCGSKCLNLASCGYCDSYKACSCVSACSDGCSSKKSCTCKSACADCDYTAAVCPADKCPTYCGSKCLNQSSCGYCDEYNACSSNCPSKVSCNCYTDVPNGCTSVDWCNAYCQSLVTCSCDNKGFTYPDTCSNCDLVINYPGGNCSYCYCNSRNGSGYCLSHCDCNSWCYSDTVTSACRRHCMADCSCTGNNCKTVSFVCSCNNDKCPSYCTGNTYNCPSYCDQYVACSCNDDCAHCGYTACSCESACANACSSKTAATCPSDKCPSYCTGNTYNCPSYCDAKVACSCESACSDGCSTKKAATCSCNGDTCGYTACLCVQTCANCGYKAATCSCNGDGCSYKAASCSCNNDTCGYNACSCNTQNCSNCDCNGEATYATCTCVYY